MNEAPPPPVQAEAQPRPTRRIPIVVVGILLALCGCGCLPIGAAILLPVFMQAKVAAQTTECISHMKDTAVAIHMYASDFDDRMPLASNWSEGLLPLVESPAVLRCPQVKSSSFGYALNGALAGKPTASIEDIENTILLYEPQTPAMNAVGDPNVDAASPPRHGTFNNECSADAHCYRTGNAEGE